MNENDLFVIPSGDGDQSFLGQPVKLRYSIQDNHKQIDEFGGIAFRVVDGEFDARLVILTPRTLINIREGLDDYGISSVIVHLPDTEADQIDLKSNRWAIGMATIEREK